MNVNSLFVTLVSDHGDLGSTCVLLRNCLSQAFKTTALNALSSLTRDADASQTWRLVGWLAVVFIPFLAGGMLSNAAQLLNQYALADMTSSVIFIALAVVAIALSFAPRLLTLALTAVGVLISLVLANLSGTGTAEWQVTPVEFSEWGSATVIGF